MNRFYTEKEKNQQERLFKVLDFIFERGYKIEDAYLADWVKECFEHAYINEDTQLNYALRTLDYCKNHSVELNVAIEKNNKTEYILDYSIDEMYYYWQDIETSKKRDETPREFDTQRFDWYTGIVNTLLEKGINSVSKTNSNGQEYSVILQELGLSDKINIVND